MRESDFYEQYSFGQRLSSGRTESFSAVEAGGRPVMVHFLRGTPEENEHTLARLRLLPPAASRLISQTFDVAGVRVIVSAPIQPFETFGAWLDERLAASGIEPPPPPAAPRRPRPESISAASQAGGDTADAPPPDPPDTPDPPDAAPPAAESSPGAFTQLFQTGAAGPDPAAESPDPDADPAEPAAASADPAVPAAQPPRQPEPPQPPESADPTPPPPEPASPGAFTRLFHTPGDVPDASGGATEPPAADTPGPTPPTAETPPGVADVRAQGGAEPPPTADAGRPPEPSPVEPPPVEPPASDSDPEETPDASPPAEPPGEGQFTQLFGVGSADSPPPPTSPEPAPPAASPPPVDRPDPPKTPPSRPPDALDSGPGHFTRLFSVGDAPSEPAPSPSEPAPSPSEPSPPRPTSGEPSTGATMSHDVPPRDDSGASDDDLSDILGPSEAATPPPDESRPAGEFTSLFGVPGAAEGASSPPLPEAGEPEPLDSDVDDYLERLADPGPTAAPPPVAEPLGPDAQVWAAPAQSGPSDFTRIVSGDRGPLAAPPPVRPEAPAAPPKLEKKRSNRPYLIGLAVILILAVTLIIVLAIVGRDSGEAEPVDPDAESVEEVESGAVSLAPGAPLRPGRVSPTAAAASARV